MSARRRSPTFWALLAFTLTVCAFLIVPVWMSMLAGVTQNYFTGWRGGLTLDWVIKVWTDYRHTVFMSIKIALACLVCTLLLGVPAAYVLAKRSNALTRAIEELLVMPVAVPGIATALALIVTYGGLAGRDLEAMAQGRLLIASDVGGSALAARFDLSCHVLAGP